MHIYMYFNHLHTLVPSIANIQYWYIPGLENSSNENLGATTVFATSPLLL